MSKVVQFLRESKAELKKVVWPSRDNVVSSVKVVIISTILIAIILGLLDIGFTGLLDRIDEYSQQTGLTKKQIDFYESCKICLEAILHFIKRLANEIEPYNKENSIALYNIHKIQPVPVSSDNQDSLLGILSDGEAIVMIRPLLKKVKFEEVENFPKDWLEEKTQEIRKLNGKQTRKDFENWQFIVL